MKVCTEIISGFLGAGKTSFINGLIAAEKCKNEKIGIIQMENGRSSLEYENNKNIIIEENCDLSYLCQSILKMKKSYNIDRIIIEYNGTLDFSKIIEEFNNKPLKDAAKINSVYFICDCRQFDVQLKNMNSYIMPAMKKSNVIVINNFINSYSDMENRIKKINKDAIIIKSINKSEFKNNIEKANIIENEHIKNIKLKIKKYLSH